MGECYENSVCQEVLQKETTLLVGSVLKNYFCLNGTTPF